MISPAGLELRSLLQRMPVDETLKNLAVSSGLTWDFSRGYAPRKFTGNWQTPEDVRLVLLMAEPSTPYVGESYPEDPEGWFGSAVQLSSPPDFEQARKLHNSKSDDFLAACGLPAHEPASHEMIAQFNSMWLTIDTPLGASPRELTEYFATEHLAPLLRSFPNAMIVAAGKKAAHRVKWAKVPFLEMGALSPPGCNHKNVVASHVATANAVRRFLPDGSADRQLLAVQAILWVHWNPLHLSGDWPSDEYDSYAPEIVGLLRSGAEASVIAERLRTIEAVKMLVSEDTSASLVAAKHLAGLTTLA